MNKLLSCTIFFVLSIQAGWCNDDSQSQQTYTQIECTVKPINRGHPKGTSPHIRVREGTSSNWSGFAAATSLTRPATGVVTDVSGLWVVPALSSTNGDSYSSFWVGIDGYSSGTVEQIGTEQDWVGSSQQNYAWYEMYPQGAYMLEQFPVDIGDQISAEVKYLGNDVFQLSIHNITQRISTVVPTSNTRSRQAKRSSAEWIVEAPSENSVLPLADFVTGNFANCSATINGVTGVINDSHWVYDQINMVGENNVVKAVTSVLRGNGTAFTVIWKHE